MTVFLQSLFYKLSGIWSWDMETEAVFCSDVMLSLPAGFIGTKGIFHPDDAEGVKEKLAAAGDEKIDYLEFRIITTYGKVKTVVGETISVQAPEDGIENWQEQVAEAALREAEQRSEHQHLQLLQQIYQTTERLTDAGIWYHNTANSKTWYSDYIFRLHGIPAQSLNAHLHTFQPFIHPEDVGGVTEFTDKALWERSPLHFEYRILTVNGEKMVAYKSQWFFSEKGEAILCGTIQDITEQKTAEQETEAYKDLAQFQKQQLHFDELHAGIGHWQIDLLTRKTIYSDNYFRIFGVKPGALPANLNSFVNFIHPDDQDAVAAAYRKLIYEHAVPELEYRIVRPDGKVRYISQKAKMMMFEREMIVSGIVQDITVQRLLEKKVAELTDQNAQKWLEQQQSQEMGGLASWIMDIETGSITWSDNVYKLLGYKTTVAEMTAKAFYSFIHPHDLKKFKDQWNLVLQEKQESIFPFRFLLRGAERFMKAIFRVQQHKGKELFIGTIQDITLEHVLQQQLANRVQLAESLMENIVDRVMITDVNNTIVLWNRACEAAYSVKKEVAVGQNFFDLFPQMKTDEDTQSLRKVLKGEKVLKHGRLSSIGNGYYDLSLMPLWNNEGEVTGILHIIHDVTKETELRNNLQDRLNFIESLLESSVDRIIALDRNMNYLYWNSKAEKYYGLPKKALLGKNILEVFPQLVNDPSYSELRRASRGETIHIPIDPEHKKYFETYLIPIKNESGEVTSILWLAHDLAKEWELQQEQRRAQQVLAEEHRRLKEAQAIGHVGSFEWQAETDRIHWSDEMYRIHGLELQSEEITLDRVMSFIHPDEPEEMKERMRRLREEAGSIFLTHWIIRADGEERFVIRNIQSYADENGRVIHLSGTVQDITDQKKAEQELFRLKDELTQQAMEKYKELLNSIDQGFCTIQVAFNEANEPVDYKFIEVSPSFENQTGITNGAGRWMRDIAPDQEEFWLQTYGRVALTGKSVRFEHYSTMLNRWSSVYAFKIGGADQRQIGVLFNDITERKQQEEHQVFLLQLSDALRLLTDPASIQETAMQLLGQHLEVNRAFYAEAQEDGDTLLTGPGYCNGVPALPTYLKISDYGSQMSEMFLAGQTLVLTNLVKDLAQNKEVNLIIETTQIRAVVGVPLIKNGKLVAAVGIHQGAPRQWTAEEVALIEEVSERTWATVGRAKAEKALQEAHARMIDIMESTTDAFYALDAEFNFTYINKKAAQLWSRDRDSLIGKNYWTEFPAAVNSESYRKHYEALTEGRSVHYETVSPLLGTWIDVSIYPGTNKSLSVFFRDITERKEAKQKLEELAASLEQQVAERTRDLEESKAFAELITQTTPDLITIHDAATTQILYTNYSEFWKDLYQNNEIYQMAEEKRAIALTHPDDIEKMKTFLAERRQLQENEMKEVELKMKGGRWIRIRSKVFKRDEQGEAKQMISFTTDISQHKEAEEEVKKNLTILKQAEDIAAIGSWEYQIPSGRFSWSDGMYRIFDYPRGAPVHPEIYLNNAVEEDRGIAKRIIKNLKKTHEPMQETMRIQREDGIRTVKIKASAVTDENGEVRKMVGVDMDITEVKEAEEKLAESRHWLEQTAKASPDAINVYDVRKKQPVYLNNCLGEWTGKSLEELVNMGIEGRLQLVHPDDRLRLLHFNELMLSARDGEIKTIEYRIRGKGDNYLWLLNRSKVFQRDKDGKVTHMLSILQDITEAKAAEEVLKNLNKSLEKKNRELAHKNDEITSFAFVASHDLKEPIRKLHTFTDWLLTREQAISAAGTANLNKMMGAVKRLDALIDDIMSLSKAHLTHEKQKQVDLNRLLEAAKEDLREEIEQSCAQIEAEPLPAITGAENLLFSLFSNLLGNAIKFRSKEASPKIVISSKEAMQEGRKGLAVSFTDNGIGFTPDHSKKIFQIFQRLHNRDEYEGTGMGLAICKKIMEKHNGTITAESKPGEGSTFTCWFPL